MRITISDIAKLANVSKSAVSIVLNNKSGVSEKTRTKVLETIKKYNYYPNQIAQSLAARETKSIGLIIKEIDNPYFAKVMKGVYDASSKLGYSVLLGSSELSSEKESEILNALLTKRVDGLLISPLQSDETDFTYLANLLNDNYPLVILGEIKNYSTSRVDINNINAAYDAVSYLIKLGHRRIAHFAGPVHSGHGQKRLEGYKQALIDNNIPINKDYILSLEPYTPHGYNAGIELFSRNIEPPSAVFCYNDLIAIGLINALLDLKIQVPEKVSVVGFDNIDFSEFVKIPLTTIQMPAYEIGSASATLLIKQITGSISQLNEKIILEHKLIERNSCSVYNEIS
jgi:LacI family transcriptional regulator/LacI family repressor for deo operon, udp, cdd, tsx, nupC, and nupG